MAKLANGYIMTPPGFCVWDGINFPKDTPPTKDKPAGVKYELGFAFDPNAFAAEYQEMWGEAMVYVAEEWPRGAPADLQHGISPVDNQKIPEIPGYLKLTAVTYNDFPEVWDANEVLLSADQVRQALYAGAKIRAIIKPRTYDSNGNKGWGFYLSSLQILDATAPRFAISGQGLSRETVRSAFASAPVAGAVPFAPAAQAAYAGAPAAPAAPVAPQHPAAPAAPVAPGVAPAAPLAPQPVAPQHPAAAPAPIAVQPNYAAVPGAVPPAATPAGVPSAHTPAATPAPTPAPASAPSATISPSEPQLTAAALAAWPGQPYGAWIQAGWTEAAMRQHGYIA